MSIEDLPVDLDLGPVLTTVGVFNVHVQGEAHGGNLVVENVGAVLEDLEGHLDGLGLLEVGDDPVVITIQGGKLLGNITITVTRKNMTREELDALPEHDGW